MKLLAYMSEYTGYKIFLEDDLRQIRNSSKRRNLELHITGVLFYQCGLFLQILEGPDHNIDRVMEIIRNDSRHKNIQILVQHKVFKRDFREWNMDQFDLSKDKKISKNKILEFTEVYKANLIPKAKELVELYKDLVTSY